MEFKVKKTPRNLDNRLSLINSMINEMCGKRLELMTHDVSSGTGDGSDSVLTLGLVATPNRWRIVGIGGLVQAKGASTILESMVWGYFASDIGATDEDAFGSVVCVVTADKELEVGDILYQGVSPYDDFFGFDALASAGVHVWDIAGTGAGVLMGDWQTKAAFLTATKKNVASSTAVIAPFVLIEFEIGGGVEQ
jgi:hypothetical protein